MHSSELCTTDPRDNGMVAGDTMLIQLGGSRGASGLVELYQRATRDSWIAGPHLLGDRGQLMIKGSPQSADYELWYCPGDVSFAAHTPAWERVEIPRETYLIEGRAWPGHPSIWSVRDMLQALVEGRQPELGGARAANSLECVSAVYESHFTGARATLPLAERGHPPDPTTRRRRQGRGRCTRGTALRVTGWCATMPALLREGPYRFYFVSGDRNEPPHVHVRRDRSYAKFLAQPRHPAKQRTPQQPRAPPHSAHRGTELQVVSGGMVCLLRPLN